MNVRGLSFQEDLEPLVEDPAFSGVVAAFVRADMTHDRDDIQAAGGAILSLLARRAVQGLLQDLLRAPACVSGSCETAIGRFLPYD